MLRKTRMFTNVADCCFGGFKCCEATCNSNVAVLGVRSASMSSTGAG